ncbi:GPI biosynthesis protein family Pig-F-domain-containing protein [Naematelia encephala]|uniref:GPI biosynthesis protein family Pig-F-domain-containing protein n=1 Tax=Naematelia encephala TaxID=71784 RepID=A0A1Y2B907_9TREE|nr:GPI biosynthesis protein family Pig-F-domain-containing protein [Naematelia encephala]
MASSFPLKEYFALHLYLSCLLIGSLLFLPRSSRWFANDSIVKIRASSLDRPEHPFLAPLTNDPLRTMSWYILGELVIMMWWGQHLLVWVTDKASTRPLDRHLRVSRLAQVPLMNQRLLEAFASTLIGAMTLGVLLTILGAPLKQAAPTILLGLHLSLLLVWPVVHCLGVPSIHNQGLVDRYRMTKLVCSLDAASPLDRALMYPMVGTACGAWIGASLLLLDWDRPWQSFPLPPTVGSLLGFLIGGFASWSRSALDSLLADLSREVVEPHSVQGKVAPKKKHQ